MTRFLDDLGWLAIGVLCSVLLVLIGLPLALLRWLAERLKVPA